MGCDPFNQNFPSEVRKYLGVEWIATGSYGLAPFQLQKFQRSVKMEDVGSLLLVLELDDEFDGDINDIV